MGGVVAAVLASRFRNKIGAWRSWHGALMSLSLLGAVTAIGGVIGGLALGVGRGTVYYRMFNGVIVIFTESDCGLSIRGLSSGGVSLLQNIAEYASGLPWP